MDFPSHRPPGGLRPLSATDGAVPRPKRLPAGEAPKYDGALPHTTRPSIVTYGGRASPLRRTSLGIRSSRSSPSGWRRLRVAVAMATQAGVAQAASQVVESIIVKLHADTPADREALAAALGTAFSVAGSTARGRAAIALQQPLTLAAARAAVNRVRLLPQVVYANVAVSPRARGRRRCRERRAGRRLARQPRVARFIVKYRDPATTNAAMQQRAAAGSSDRSARSPRRPARRPRARHVRWRLRRAPVPGASGRRGEIARALPRGESGDRIRRAGPAAGSPCSCRTILCTRASGTTRARRAEMGGVNLPPAWDITTGSASVVVAVIDTGSLPRHPDLAGRYVGGLRLHRRPCWSRTTEMAATRIPSDPGDWITAAEAASGYFAGCPAAQQHVPRVARGGHDRRRQQQRDRRRGHQLGQQDSAAARARQMRRLHVGHRRCESAGRRACRFLASRPIRIRRGCSI